jgi:glucose/arabinose dehydrogenase
LRNPFRYSFDAPTGRLFLADVGQNIWEEVNIIVKGGDYGWSWREGNHTYNSPPAPTTPPGPAQPGDPPGTGYNPINPIFEYDHTNSGAGDIFGTSITGGMVMRGDRLPELFGAYIYADYNSAQIVALRQNGATWTSQIIASDNNIVDFGLDPRNDDLLLCDLSSGQVRRLARSGTTEPIHQHCSLPLVHFPT